MNVVGVVVVCGCSNRLLPWWQRCFLFQWVCLFVCVKAALIERCQCLLLLLLLKSVKVFAVVWQIDGEAWCCFASVCFVAHGTSESLSLSVV